MLRAAEPELDVPLEPMDFTGVTAYDVVGDGWVRAARYTLIFTGICYLLCIGIGPLWARTMFNDPKMPADFNAGFGIGFTLVIAVVCIGIATANFAAAVGIGKGKRWGWIVGIALGAVYTPSICLPFGAVILYGLLREPVRRAYLDRAASPGA